MMQHMVQTEFIEGKFVNPSTSLLEAQTDYSLIGKR